MTEIAALNPKVIVDRGGSEALADCWRQIAGRVVTCGTPAGDLDVLLAELGGHDADAVVLHPACAADLRADLAAFGTLVRPGGRILVDGIAGRPGSDAWRAWAQITRQFGTAEIANPGEGPGWGVILVAGGEDFDPPRHRM